MQTITVKVGQLPVGPQYENPMRWNMDEFIISYNRRTKVCTVEEFEGFTDEGDELTTVLDADSARRVIEQDQPGWIGLDGFVALWDYDGEHMTFGTEPI